MKQLLPEEAPMVGTLSGAYPANSQDGSHRRKDKESFDHGILKGPMAS
jgi:hypothetical protein